MDCRSFGVHTILVGLHRVGLVGFRDALDAAAASGLDQREAIVTHLVERLAADNYIPDPGNEPFRIALWREFLRHRGEDFREFFSEVEVTVRGEAGEERDRFVERLEEVFGDFELRPVVEFAPSTGEGRHPQLVIHDEAIVRGLLSRQNFKTAVRKSITDW